MRYCRIDRSRIDHGLGKFSWRYPQDPFALSASKRERGTDASRPIGRREVRRLVRRDVYSPQRHPFLDRNSVHCFTTPTSEGARAMVTPLRYASVIAVLSLGCANLGIAADKSAQDEARDLADKIKKATQGGGAASSSAAVKLPKR